MATTSKDAVGGVAAGRGYPDLHEHIAALRDAGLLIEVTRPINKDTEMHPLVRWQFRGGIDEADRKAFLFTNVVDSKGRKYEIPVLVCGLAANRKVYSLGMGVPIDRIRETWIHALNNPIPPNVVARAACHELVYEGADLLNGNGLDAIPVPISTPGWDNAPYFSSSHFITKDPTNGVQNMGNYRAMVKAPDRIGMNTSIELRTGGYLHWLEWKKRGEPMPCAIVVGAPPCVSFTAVQKVPEKDDELAVSGGLAGTALNVVKAKTVDLLVPAEAEVVIEGFVDTEYLEPEAPFGESHGHVNLQEYNAYMNISAITRRRDAVITSWVSQVTPSESSAIKRPAYEAAQLEHLRDHLGIKGVVRIVTHQPLTGNRRMMFVVLERGVPRTEVWRALYGMVSLQRNTGKIIIAVNDDIDPKNLDAVMWAIAFRASPHLDMEILKHQDRGHGPSESAREGDDSALLVDATLKQDYPPVSLPKREYMERARDIWENRLGLPKIAPEAPWFGYALGDWPAALVQEAERAVAGDFWETGRLQAQRRRNDVAMNTEVRDVPDPPDEPGGRRT